MTDIIEQIKTQIAENPIILFMKGSPQLPQCGFSARSVAALQSTGVDFASVDVLANPDIRTNLPSVSNWPTFPQLFVNGELVGGCDIIMEYFENGQLSEILAIA